MHPQPTNIINRAGEVWRNQASIASFKQNVPVSWREIIAEVFETGCVKTRQILIDERLYSIILTPIGLAAIGGGVVIETISDDTIACIDELTLLFNRKSMRFFLEQSIAMATRNNKPLTAVMLDLDHFKSINDQYGHQIGDLVLEQFAKILRKSKRTSDTVIRYGGEEFLLLLPGINALEALPIIERLRKVVEGKEMVTTSGIIQVTMSAGLAEHRPRIITPMELIDEADRKLYAAKQAGRNMVFA